MMGQNFIEVQRLNKNLIFFCINKKDNSKNPFYDPKKIKKFFEKKFKNHEKN